MQAGKKDEQAADASGLDESKSAKNRKDESEKEKDKENGDVINSRQEDEATPHEGVHVAAEGAGRRKSPRFIVFIGAPIQHDSICCVSGITFAFSETNSLYLYLQEISLTVQQSSPS